MVAVLVVVTNGGGVGGDKGDINGESAKIRLLSCELWHSGHVFWLQYQQMLTG